MTKNLNIPDSQFKFEANIRSLNAVKSLEEFDEIPTDTLEILDELLTNSPEINTFFRFEQDKKSKDRFYVRADQYGWYVNIPPESSEFVKNIRSQETNNIIRKRIANGFDKPEIELEDSDIYTFVILHEIGHLVEDYFDPDGFGQRVVAANKTLNKKYGADRLGNYLKRNRTAEEIDCFNIDRASQPTEAFADNFAKTVITKFGSRNP